MKWSIEVTDWSGIPSLALGSGTSYMFAGLAFALKQNSKTTTKELHKPSHKNSPCNLS